MTPRSKKALDLAVKEAKADRSLQMDDGTEREFGPGDTFHMPPGHDAWIVVDETCVLLDFGGLKGYAQAT